MNTRARKLPPTWIIKVIVNQRLVSIGWIDWPTECVSRILAAIRSWMQGGFRSQCVNAQDASRNCNSPLSSEKGTPWRINLFLPEIQDHVPVTVPRVSRSCLRAFSGWIRSLSPTKSLWRQIGKRDNQREAADLLWAGGKLQKALADN